MTRYWPPLPTEDQLTTAALTADGKHIQGWVRQPEGAIWKPEDLLWLPPSATKSTDIDRAGRIVDVAVSPDEMAAWVTAEVNKHERYLEVLRQRVKAGTLKLTAMLAKWLGFDFADGAELVPRNLQPAFKSLQAEPERSHDGPIWQVRKHWVS